MRERLLEKLSSRTDENLILVIAPAAYGKTTLLAEWANRQSGSVTWVTLDEDDNDLARLWASIGSALLAAKCGITSAGTGALSAISEIPVQFALGPLLSELATLKSPVSIILDEYQYVTEMPVHESVHFFLEHLPTSVHVAFGSRVDPPFPISRLRVLGRVMELRANSLAFNEEEAAELLHIRTKLVLQPEIVRKLLSLTDGWVMGLRAAAFALSQSSDPGEAVKSVGSHDWQMPDSIRREVFDEQTDSAKEFLVRASVLDELSAEACDYVLERSDSAQILTSLDRADLFITPIDESRQWFKINPLVLQMLRTRMETRGRAELIRLHRRASVWCSANRQLETAIRHALAGEDWDSAIRLIAELGQPMIPNNRPAILHGWLSKIPQAYLFKEPYVCVQLARTLMYISLFSDFEPLLSLAETRAQEANDSILMAAVFSARAHAACFAGEHDRGLGLAEAGLKALPPHELLQRGVIQQLQSIAYLMSDRPIEAETHAVQSFQNSLSAGNAFTACLALGMRGFVNCRRGRLPDAYRYIDQAEKLAQSTGQTELFVLPFHKARIHLDSLNLVDTGISLKEAEESCDRTGFRIFTTSVHLLRARLRWMQGLTEMARESLRIHNEVVRSIGGLRDIFTASDIYARIAMEQEDIIGVENWLASYERSGEIMARITWLRATAWIAARKGEMALATQMASELNSLGARCTQVGLGTDAVTCLVSSAATFIRTGETAAARSVLLEALKIAEPGALFGPFWEERKALDGVLENLSKENDSSSFIGTLLDKLRTDARTPDSLLTKSIVSSKELEILLLLAQGHSNEAISSIAEVSSNTVKTHLQHIYLKLNVKNRTQAVSTARAMGIIS